MLHINAIGDVCPLPVIKTKQAIGTLNGSGQAEVLVDNEIAVQNLVKLAAQKGWSAESRADGDHFAVLITVGEGETASAEVEAEMIPCMPHARNVVVAVTGETMGNGDEKLGKTLMKGFLYALTQQDELPRTVLFYNGGAVLTCEGSPALEDLRALEAEGVRIMTCGTCLNFYGLTDQLRVGTVTNMYDIAETLTKADLVVRP